jgi:hypothetical protein
LRTLERCEHECNDNQTCWSNCVAKANVPNANAFWKCVIDNNCLDQVEEIRDDPFPHECLEKKCSDDWKKCESDTQCIPTIHDCYVRCADKASCWDLCLAAKKDQAAINVMKCGKEQGCFDQILAKAFETAVAVFDPQECIK